MGNPIRYEDGDTPWPIIIGIALWLAAEPAVAPTNNPQADKQAVDEMRQRHDDQVIGAIRVALSAPNQTVSTAISAVNGIRSGNNKGSNTTTHKNNNNAEGNFVLYEVRDNHGTGEKLKVGKANADDLMRNGDVRRANTSERKAKQEGYPNAKAVVTDKLGKTTTGEAKKAEAAKVRDYRSQGHKLPLNKERDKNYRPK